MGSGLPVKHQNGTDAEGIEHGTAEYKSRVLYLYDIVPLAYDCTGISFSDIFGISNIVLCLQFLKQRWSQQLEIISPIPAIVYHICSSVEIIIWKSALCCDGKRGTEKQRITTNEKESREQPLTTRSANPSEFPIKSAEISIIVELRARGGTNQGDHILFTNGPGISPSLLRQKGSAVSSSVCALIGCLIIVYGGGGKGGGINGPRGRAAAKANRN